MCSVGWAEEDPGRWSMTWYGTRHLIVKIFCLQIKSNLDSSNACFSTFTSSGGQVWAILPEKNPLHTERERGQFQCFVFLIAASSSKVIEAWTLHFKIHGMCSLQVCHEISGTWTASLDLKQRWKLCFVTVSFFTRKYPALTVSMSSMEERDLEIVVSLWSLQVCTVLC